VLPVLPTPPGADACRGGSEYSSSRNFCSRSVSFDTWSDVQCSDWCTVLTLMPRAESGAENSPANAAIT
jgi:hypothetical protein